MSISSNKTCPKSISSLREILVSFLKMKFITLREDLKIYILYRVITIFNTLYRKIVFIYLGIMKISPRKIKFKRYINILSTCQVRSHPEPKIAKWVVVCMQAIDCYIATVHQTGAEKNPVWYHAHRNHITSWPKKNKKNPGGWSVLIFIYMYLFKDFMLLLRKFEQFNFLLGRMGGGGVDRPDLLVHVRVHLYKYFFLQISG